MKNKSDKVGDPGKFDQLEVMHDASLMFTSPQRINTEPVELQLERRRGIWRCNPQYINDLKINGGDIPLTRLVLFRVQEISWTAASNEPPITSACPTDVSGGFFRQVKLHGTVFGLGSRYIGCRSDFGIEGNAGAAWVAVNDTLYTDNNGHIVVRVSWQ